MTSTVQSEVARLSRLRSAAVNGLVLLTTLTISLFVCEWVVRLVRPQELIVPRPELYRPDDLFGWRHVENADTTINTGGGLVRMRIDSRGYRITSEPGGAGAGGPRVLMLGDSFLEATAVQSEDVVSAVVARRLTSMTGRPALVDNTGVGGWDPNHYLLEAKRALARDTYDVGVVMLYIGNDMMTTIAERYPARQPSQRHYFRFPKEVSKKELIDAVLYPINDALETRSHLFLLAKNGLDAQLARIGLSARYFPPIFQLSERTSDRWDITATICRSIQAEFDRHKVPVIFALIPTPYQVDQKSFESQVVAFDIDPQSVDLDLPNKMMTERFQAGALQFVDPLEAMRHAQSQGQSLYGAVDAHLNAEGHRFLAEMLMPKIHEVLAVPQESAALRRP